MLFLSAIVILTFLRSVGAWGSVDVSLSRWTGRQIFRLRGGIHHRDVHRAAENASANEASDDEYDSDDDMNPCAIVVDPMDYNGRYFMSRLQEWGVEPLVVLSPGVAEAIGPELSHLAAPIEGEETQWAKECGIQPASMNSDDEKMSREIKRPLLGVFSESDAGIETALRLEEAMLHGDDSDSNNGLFGNGRSAIALRWKHETVEAVENAGLRTPRQLLARSWEEAREFLVHVLGVPYKKDSVTSRALPARSLSVPQEDAVIHSEGGGDDVAGDPNAFPLRAVLKPFRGAASMDVCGVTCIEEAEDAFDLILGTPSHGGNDIGINDAVLIQEYLLGNEFAVDTVSLDGEHKICAVWKYDKRAVNGCKAPTVYFGTKLCSLPPIVNSADELKDDDNDTVALDKVSGEERFTRCGGDGGGGGGNQATPEEVEALAVAEYVCKVLTACGMKDGPAHTEVKWGGADADADFSSATLATRARTSKSESNDGEEEKRMHQAGPAIVEVNARWHATNFRPLVDECLPENYPNALDATIFAMLAKASINKNNQDKKNDRLPTEARVLNGKDGEGGKTNEEDVTALLLSAGGAAWTAMPRRYGRLRKFGCLIHLVSYVSGDLVGLRHQSELGEGGGEEDDTCTLPTVLPSVDAAELSVAVGVSTLVPTVDISASDCGCVRLVHEDLSQVEADYDRIVNHLMPTMFIVE